MTLVPEAWQNDTQMVQYKRDFYKWCSMAVEPWDGPGNNKHIIMININNYLALLYIN